MAIQTLTIEDAGTGGLNTDISPWSLPPKFLTSGINFRIYANSIKASGGYSNWGANPTQFNPGYLMHALSTSGDYWLIAGRSAVYSFDGQTWSDISSVNGYAGLGPDDELNWTGCMLGKIALVNNPQHYPEYWSPVSPGVALQPLNFSPTETWKDKGYTFKVLKAHQNFLFALNLQEGLQEIPGGYRWSHPADINGLPFTWDENEPSGLAGRAQLGGDGGAIIDGLSLRDSFVIYSETAIDILDFTGDEFVFRRRELSNTVGLVSKNCIVEVKGRHYFIGDGDILVNDGHTIKSLLHNRLRTKFTAQINSDRYNRSYAVRLNSSSEIWFCVPEEDADYPNIAYIYNWTDDTWALRELPQLNPIDEPLGSGKQVTFANYGPQAEPTLSWDDWVGNWEDQIRVWGSRTRTPLDDTIVGCTTNSELLILDPNELGISHAGTRIERTAFPLEGHRQVTSITSIIPHISGTHPVTIQLGSMDYAGGPTRWKPSVIFNPDEQRKVDIRTTGELHCWRIQSVDQGNWTFSGMDIIYTKNGER